MPARTLPTPNIFVLPDWMDWVRWLIGWPDRDPAQALAGKVVLLTGSSSGIGREIALQLGRVGARLVLASRDNAALLQLRSQIINSEHAGRQVEQPAVLGIDLADLPSLQSRAEEALAVWGKLDILVHCAGQTVRAAALDTELAVYQQLLAVNFLGCCELTRACGAALRESRGQVAVVGSVQVGRWRCRGCKGCRCDVCRACCPLPTARPTLLASMRCRPGRTA